MAQTHDGRVMEASGWSTTDVWPVPVECLLNGITSTDTHLMFGGSHMIQHQFRHRFHPPSIQHLNGTSHLISINPNASLPTHSHSIIEESVAVDRSGQVDGSVVNGENGQESLSQNIPLRDDVLDESDETSEDEEDITENGNQMSIAHSLTDATLVQVQCGEQGPVVQDNLVHSRIPMSTEIPHHHQLHQIHQKLGNGVSVMGHAPHSMHGTPMNPIFFQQEEEFEGSPVEEPGNDPNTGFSVYGKLYYEREGRVVLHLKQWMDSPSDQNGGGMTFAPSDPLNGKTLLQGCALCRFRSPNQTSCRNQKQGHRHTFRGVLFTFEECTIVELYPEQNHGINSAQNDLKQNEAKIMRSHGGQEEQHGQNLGISAYLPRPPEEQLQQQQHMEMNPLGVVEPPPGLPEDKAHDHQEWWDEFESDEELKENEESSEISEDEGEGQPSPIIEQDLHSSGLNVGVGGMEEPTYPEASTVYPHESSFLHEPNDEESEGKVHSETSTELHSIILRESHEGRCRGESQDENLATPRNNQGDADPEELNFSLAVSEVDGEERLAQQPPPPVTKPHQPRRKGKYVCPCCPKVMGLKKSLLLHLDEEHPDNRFRCPKCTTQFGDEKGLGKHPCIVTGEEPRKCRTGRKSRAQTLKTELLPVSLKGESENGLRNGDREPSGPRKPSEGKCKMRKEKKRAFPKKTHHTHPFSPKKSTKPFPCNICGKNFSVQRRLDTHRLSHANEKSSQCEKCGKRFARKDKLMRHMFVHSEEKMFECEVCSKRFSRRDKLTDHLKSHGSPDESHHCPFCQKEFLRPDILKQHVKLHGMGNKHQCTDCLRFVTGKERLQQHMARHEEAKAQGQPLLCPLCTKNFIQRQSLKAHIKKFHPHAHARLLSDLDFPPDQFEMEEERAESPKGDGKTQVARRRFPCDLCSKHFSKKGAVLRHSAKHHPPPPTANDLNPRSTKEKKFKKGKRAKRILEMERRGSPRNPFPPDPLLVANGDIIHVHGLTFTSAASEIVSPPDSPPRPYESDTLREELSGVEFHLEPPGSDNLPLTLTRMGLSQQGGTLLGSHGLLASRLQTLGKESTQHGLSQIQILPPISQQRNEGGLGDEVSLGQHVRVREETLIGTPYVYPHYYH